MHALLRRIGIGRREVRVLGAAAAPAAGSCPRRCGRRPRPSCGERASIEVDARPTALAGVAVIEAANAEEEALAIAVALREAMETRARPPRW